ncbi:hypothetical protein HK098_003939 [Nowakowskiella sp. JEL0407]|nr:hypothetical protein HK098_003939 [Nowakowskiella sp. JEL0407]
MSLKKSVEFKYTLTGLPPKNKLPPNFDVENPPPDSKIFYDRFELSIPRPSSLSSSNLESVITEFARIGMMRFALLPQGVMFRLTKKFGALNPTQISKLNLVKGDLVLGTFAVHSKTVTGDTAQLCCAMKTDPLPVGGALIFFVELDVDQVTFATETVMWNSKDLRLQQYPMAFFLPRFLHEITAMALLKQFVDDFKKEKKFA